ncbi:ribosome maturation factor RimM [Pasteuria penetrans]|uniref:ribosome maturation factor RimM n=1 Tax=Pasteuria penetrans TaxID=86005 RepID=UPI000F9733D9|nr:ribosome maturation factor RimM [Pasteuria penetrans]
MVGPLPPTRWLMVGSIVATQGLCGGVRVHSTTDFPEIRFQKGGSLWVRPPVRGNPFFPLPTDPLRIARSRPHRAGYIVHFVGWDSIEVAERYRGCRLAVPYEDQAPSVEGEYYYQDIVGCRVETVAGENLGEVIGIRSMPAQDLWVVRDPGGQVWMLPYTDALVKEVDVSRKRVSIVWLEGLRG